MFKFFKNYIGLSLIFILSVNSFAAIYGDGDDKYIISGSTSFLPGNLSGTDTWAMTFWLYLMKSPSYPYGSYAIASSKKRCYAEVYPTDSYFVFDTASVLVPTGSIDVGKWHHIAVVVGVHNTSRSIKVWVDGRVCGTEVSPPATVFDDTTQPWHLMSMSGDSYFATGYMEDVRIYKNFNYFSTDTVKNIMSKKADSNPNLVFWMPFDTNEPVILKNDEERILIRYSISKSSQSAPLKQTMNGER